MTAQINAKTMEKAALLYERYGITLDDLLDDVLKRVKMSPVPESLMPVTSEEELAERLNHGLKQAKEGNVIPLEEAERRLREKYGI